MSLEKFLNIFKTEEEIRASMPLSEVVPILKDNLLRAKQNQEIVSCTIVNIKKNGFLVKVKGIFAYIPISLMPWKYQPNMWQMMAHEIVGARLKAFVVEFEESRIILDARVTTFLPFELVDGTVYKVIILSKSKNYCVVELGHRYNWKYGSLSYFINLDSPNYLEIDYTIHSISDEIEITFINSANNWKRVAFGKIEKEIFDYKETVSIEQNDHFTQKKYDKLKSAFQKLVSSRHEAVNKYEKIKVAYQKLVETRHTYNIKGQNLKKENKQQLLIISELVLKKLKLESENKELRLHLESELKKKYSGSNHK